VISYMSSVTMRSAAKTIGGSSKAIAVTAPRLLGPSLLTGTLILRVGLRRPTRSG
jgi:hypothetical protein